MSRFVPVMLSKSYPALKMLAPDVSTSWIFYGASLLNTNTYALFISRPWETEFVGDGERRYPIWTITVVWTRIG